MNSKTQIRWHCMNPNCRKEALTETESAANGAKPVCSCGSPMKKAYAPPVLRYLDFLHLEEGELVPRSRKED